MLFIICKFTLILIYIYNRAVFSAPGIFLIAVLITIWYTLEFLFVLVMGYMINENILVCKHTIVCYLFYFYSSHIFYSYSIQQTQRKTVQNRNWKTYIRKPKCLIEAQYNTWWKGVGYRFMHINVCFISTHVCLSDLYSVFFCFVFHFRNYGMNCFGEVMAVIGVVHFVEDEILMMSMFTFDCICVCSVLHKICWVFVT